MNHIKFSVLLSVYYKESSNYLQQSLNSIWDSQVLKPNEIIIVKDGLLNDELNKTIEDFANKAPVKTICLKKNMGLGIALAIGIKECSNDVIARMDSDDIASPDRFAKQINYMLLHPWISLLSSNIAEFITEPSATCSIRNVPSSNRNIQNFAKKRNPMNHMAVVFRKTAVLNSGNYQPFKGYEDYFLWVRMFQKGYKAANINENLVFARIGNNMFTRRQGIKFFKEEFKLQNEFLKMNFINRFEWFRNMIFRAFPRLLPIFALKMIYKTLRK